MTLFNRCEVAGVTVRFYVERKDAITVANRLTQHLMEQHRVVSAKINDEHVGWLIEKTDKSLMDVDGNIPTVVGQALKIRR